ncbi:MAG: HsdR family type I site-specific deoxyribonuclease, partial [Actinomycetota bacterium]|nr:HsdR family type I site-specific deoxyribonuclease [Actinomycetota bacterium]
CLRSLNPDVPSDAPDKAVEVLTTNRAMTDRVRANREVHKLLREGVTVVTEVGGKPDTVLVRLVDWNDVDANDWLAVTQFWVIGEMYRRRVDVMLFVNGVPLVLIELKVSHKNVRNAYEDNLRDYRAAIPRVFWFNAFVILSNGADTRVGATFAPWDHFAEWKRINSEGELGVVSLETALRGTCERHRLLDIVENFVAYTERPGGLVKTVAKNHQYLGVNNALDALLELKQREGRLGVFWHTQGSGKTLSNLWFTQKVLRKIPGNWTFVQVTDRKELDEQLYEDFADSGVLTTGENIHAESSAHLRQLLTQDHRYVFTLIHKFRPPQTGADMPILSERDDIVVITDEAHRSQYDILAWNMRRALPNASFLGFTGTPLIAGEEELTRQVFGDYVSIYNFRDSIEDGATVPLYYENRIPELQLVNEDFDEELEELLEAAALDPDQEKAVARQFSRQYHLIARTDRLDEIAEDLVRHFVHRGFRGKAMYVAIDKATAVRMYNLVHKHWYLHLAELEEQLAITPKLERPPLESKIEFMRTTDMAVVVSQAQNEVADMAEMGLDIVPHRRRMNEEDLDSRFKDPDDPFRLVFVCAMWLTGFDAPACSTIYLDKPMRNHTLMQTIARANRVFPDKDSGLIVDYVGVFRNLERALAIYGGPRGGDPDRVDAPIRPKDELVEEFLTALTEVTEFLDTNDIDLDDLVRAQGFEFVALQNSAVEALLVDDATRRHYLTLARRVRDHFKSLLPDPHAQASTRTVAVVRSLASRIESLTETPDISEVMGDVEELLDRSVGAEEYVIRQAAQSADVEPLIDLNRLDFEALLARFAGQKRTAAKRLERHVEQGIDRAVRQNPTRIDLAERFRRLIEDYNAGTYNLEQFLRRLVSLNSDLLEEEQRAIREDLTEAELAIFDLLTKPEPELTDRERDQVKRASKRLLAHVEEKLVLDWRKRMQTRAAVQVAVGKLLDEELPEIYGPEIYDRKCQLVYEHIYASYFDDGRSVYEGGAAHPPSMAQTTAAESKPVDAYSLTEEIVRRINEDSQFAAMVALQLRGEAATWARPSVDLIAADETDEVEFKSTARWNLREGKRDKRMEDAITKTIAAFLNTRGGTLFIGVSDNREPVGLDHDYATVKPPNADGFVNWLGTLMAGSLGHAAAMRTRVRIEPLSTTDICRIDVAASSEPVLAKTTKAEQVLFARLHNTTREVPDEEIESYIRDRWGEPAIMRLRDLGHLPFT